MSRIKIDFGIDLGTTNSAIAKMVRGDVRIIKSDFFQKDTLPSCVGFMKRRDRTLISVGDEAYSQLERDRRLVFSKSGYHSEIFIEFKRTMGTNNEYYSQHMQKGYSSEELSAEVMKKLKSFEKNEQFNAVIVTVPAKFTFSQKDATVRAAKLAGFDYCELIQEPVAASIAFGLDSEIKSGHWIVFDFGGGTFDVALMKVEEGIMRVLDTDGDNYLGGKNIDYAIIEDYLIPYIKANYSISGILSDPVKLNDFRNEWKGMIEKAKIKISQSDKDFVELLTELGEDFGVDDHGRAIELDLELRKEDFERVASPIFQKSIDITKNLLERNNLSGDDLATVILVGGPTYTPFFRKMLREQITEKLSTNKDPMTVVAEGAALYASTVDIPDTATPMSRDTQKVNLDVKFEASSVEDFEFVSIKLAEPHGDIDGLDIQLQIEVSRGSGWSTGLLPFNLKGEVMEVSLEPNKANVFNIDLYDSKGNKIKISPEEFTILQGFRQGQSGAILPYHIGIEVHDTILDRGEFIPIQGLEKNVSTPVTGTENRCRTPRQLRPGYSSDIINIPIFQGDYNAAGTKAFYNHYVANVCITGDDVPVLVPANSPINLTIKVLRDEQMFISAYFPNIDYEVEREVEIRSMSVPGSATIKSYIEQAKKQVMGISEGSRADERKKIITALDDLIVKLEQGGSDYERQNNVLVDLRKQQIAIDLIEKESELPKMKERMQSEFFRLEGLVKEITNKNLAEGSELDTIKVQNILEEFRNNVSKLMKDHTDSYQQMRAIKELTDKIAAHVFLIIDALEGVKLKISHIQYYNNNYHKILWTDPQKARSLIDKGLRMSAQNPNEDDLLRIIKEIYTLLPKEEQDKLIKDG